ncbi:site-specific integrase [Bacillus thuringiensis]|uniref:site-specific integrase n=1 Tax=Bacillus thuringiensis TaxID=1428 RepID=UPI0021D68756|nr:site-specific integrase [Bacillus thuringiensis]MCU7667760.1 site-specific integrase [Bacillus thuringiensis]
MYSIEIVRKGLTSNKVITINSHELTICKNEKFIHDTLPGVLQELLNALVDNNNSRFSSILQEYKQIGIMLVRAMEILHPKEFESHCLYVINQFRELNESIKSYRPILKYMITNDLDKSLHQKNDISTKYYERTELTRKVYNEFLENKFEEILMAFKNDDISSIQKLVFYVGEIPLRNKIQLNEKNKSIFESFVRRVGESLINKEIHLTPLQLARYIFAEPASDNHPNKFMVFANLDIIKEVSTYVCTTIADKPNNYNFSDDVWVIREKNIQGFKSTQLDFRHFSDKDKIYIKRYIDEIVSKTAEKADVTYARLRGITVIYKRATELPYNTSSLLELNYYHLIHLADYLQQLKDDKGNRKYNLTTIHGFFTYVRIYMDWYIDNIDSLQGNSFREVKFNNIKAFSERNEYIPESIVYQIDKVIHEISEMQQNVWRIMMNCGIRFSDAQHLKENCISYDEEIQSYVLTFLNVKMENQRLKSGESPYHTIPVEKIVVDIVERQKEISQNLRLVSGSDFIFLTFNGSAAVKINGNTLATSINNLIKKHDIKDDNGELYHYKNHQCRKTVIVDLLSQGLSLKQVADYINHSEKTSARHYRDVESKKIAELDNDMFEQLFTETLNEEIRNQYDEGEIKTLLQEVKLGARETPEGHGTCAKHVSFGPCHKKSCVGCKMLVTGPQKLPKWYQLYSEQQQYIEEMEAEYHDSGIDNYQEHRIYQQEHHLLDVYKDTINKIETWAKGRGISIEQYK